MQRAEIPLVDLEPVQGAEANKRRPAVIVSNDGANAPMLHINREMGYRLIRPVIELHRELKR